MKKLSGGGLFGGSSACLKVIPDLIFFVLELPNQVMSKGDYYKDLKANDYKTRQIKNFIASDCNYVFYGIQKNNHRIIQTQDLFLYIVLVMIKQLKDTIKFGFKVYIK